MRSEETSKPISIPDGGFAQCPECCWIGGQHNPTCSQPLVTKRFPDDSDEERRSALALERANSRAADWLLNRGLNPHAYRAGSGR